MTVTNIADGNKSGDLRAECRTRQIALRILEARRRRKDEFDHSMFGEPAWEMLLELFVRDTAGLSSTASQLKEMVGVLPSTGSRWLQYLELQALVARREHSLDPSIEFVELTEKGRRTLERYLGSLSD